MDLPCVIRQIVHLQVRTLIVKVVLCHTKTGMHSMESQKKLETKLKRHKVLEQSIENHYVSFQSKQKRPINLGLCF
ncbi:unnamed protein product [Camellia sinensis]